MTFLIFIAVLLILVLVHEAGHFFAARMGGVAVDEFGFGFPPRLFGWKGKRTLYSLNWLPLGGFVKLKGEEGEHANDSDSFAAASIGRRIWIVSAGVLMNVLLGVVLFWFLFSYGITAVVPAEWDRFANIANQRVQIEHVFPETPAMAAGLRQGDMIRSIESAPIVNVAEVQERIAAGQGKALQMVVEGSDHIARAVTVVPEGLPEFSRPSIGVQLVSLATISYPWYIAWWKAIEATGLMLADIVRAFGGLLMNLVTRGTVPADVAGPVGIAVATGRVVQQGFTNLIYFIAMLSLNLAVINILPIPALDGGRLFFFIIEKVRRRALDREFEKKIHMVGFALLLTLVILVTYRDLTNFSGTILSAMRNLLPFWTY